MRLTPDAPVGRPPYELSDDEIATAIDLLCRGAAEARGFVTVGLLEVPITIFVRKAARRLKKQLGLTNLEIWGEAELLDASNDDPEVLGRIDIIFRFARQFGDEEDYLGVECKRVAHGDSTLNQRYVSQGVSRFVTGQYATGHPLGMMLGYIMKLPSGPVVNGIDGRIRKTYGEGAKLDVIEPHADSLALRMGALTQGSQGHMIRLVHIFVDMTPVSPIVNDI